MTERFDQLSIPDDGKIVGFGAGSSVPDTPVVPIGHGTAPGAISAARRVLDTAAELTGRQIYWLRVFIGENARERYDGVPIPADAIRAFRRFRVGLIGPLARTDRTARTLANELRHRLALTAGVDRLQRIDGVPSPVREGRDVDLTVFREISDDPESAPGEVEESRGELPEEAAGSRIAPISKTATESLVEAAIEYTLDRDLNTLTIVHGGGLSSASEGGFADWASTFLLDEYSDAIIDEKTFRAEYIEQFPDDEVVVKKRPTDQVCRDLLSNPEAHDVIVAAARSGRQLASIATEEIGGVGVAPQVLIGRDRVIVRSQSGVRRSDETTAGNPIGSILAGCLLFEYFGWDDAARMIRDAVSTTLENGLVPRDLYRRRARGTPVSAAEFGGGVVEQLTIATGTSDSGGVKTTVEERAAIKRIIAGVHNIVFADTISPDEIELNQLLDEDEEADVALPEVGLNFYYWRQWSIERRLEVVLHELAHVDEGPDEPDHGPEFYDRFVELVEIASDWTPELEVLLGSTIDFKKVERSVVESVHEETIETDVETVNERKQILRRRFGLAEGDHF